LGRRKESSKRNNEKRPVKTEEQVDRGTRKKTIIRGGTEGVATNGMEISGVTMDIHPIYGLATQRLVEALKYRREIRTLGGPFKGNE